MISGNVCIYDFEERPILSAYEYAKKGLSVMPLNGKKPILDDWPNRGVATQDEIDEWVDIYPSANIGLVLGSGSGYIGPDVDGIFGEELLQELSKGDIPVTWEFITPGGGRRLLYIYPEGLDLKTRKLGGNDHNELRLMSTGSQTVLPPSIHPNRGIYKWVPGRSPDDIKCAEAPAWMI